MNATLAPTVTNVTEVLSRFVDLGFEKLGLSEADHKALLLAFVGGGRCRAGNHLQTALFRRGDVRRGRASNRPGTTLPVHWKQGVLAIDARDRVTWIGKRVRPKQVGPVHLARYRDAGDPWQLRSDP